jgi:hypothetical protein
MSRRVSDVRSVGEWRPAHKAAWGEACRPAIRLKPGGSASHLAPVSRNDIANRYGAFPGFLQRRGLLDLLSSAAGQVTPANVALYVEELKARVRSFTVWNAMSYQLKYRLTRSLLWPHKRACPCPSAAPRKCEYPLLSQSGHAGCAQRCPLLRENGHDVELARCPLLTQSGH